jgi:2-amino-4-hydroxy-6-hydroxymethyldihydropteridine diphosphokinase
MNLDIWFSWYKFILEEFNFSKNDDEKSAEILNNLLESVNRLSPEKIIIKNKVIIFGAGPSLKKNIKQIKKLELNNFTIISADGATTALLEEKITPQIIVTDLDGKMEDIIKANKNGAILVIHAHGNNSDKIKKYVPLFDKLIGTTQSNPFKNVYNFGGFTDGDRCVFLAIELGAKVIILGGMDFGKIITKYSRPEIKKSETKADKIKETKLYFAKKLIEWAAKNEKIQIYNLSRGEKLIGVNSVSIDYLHEYLS